MVKPEGAVTAGFGPSRFRAQPVSGPAGFDTQARQECWACFISGPGFTEPGFTEPGIVGPIGQGPVFGESARWHSSEYLGNLARTIDLTVVDFYLGFYTWM